MKVDITEKTVQQVKAVLDNRAWDFGRLIYSQSIKGSLVAGWGYDRGLYKVQSDLKIDYLGYCPISRQNSMLFGYIDEHILTYTVQNELRKG